MPSTLFNQLRTMFRTTPNNRESALANNYTYVNEDKISRSLICSVCLDPFVDPYTHIKCENSFCHRCVRKLRQCPCCRASIANSQDLKVTSHVIRNILDELEVQCNVCRQTLARGQFSFHIANNCLIQSPITVEDEQNLVDPPSTVSTVKRTYLDEQQMEKHLSNLYRRIHTLENELFELKKAIFICLLVVAVITTAAFLGSIFSYVIVSFLSVVFTQWLPSILQTVFKILFDFSPSMTLFRIIFLGIYFFLFCYKSPPSDTHVATVIICAAIVIFNVFILLLHLVFNHFNLLFSLYVIFLISRYCRRQLPNNPQFIAFINNLRPIVPPTAYRRL